MGVVPPDSTGIPIIRSDRILQEKNGIPAPRSYIHPRIDGEVTSYFKWNSAMKVVPASGFGTMHRAGHMLLSCFYYGFSADEIFFRFDMDNVAVENVHEIELEILFQLKSLKFNSIIDPMNGRLKYSFVKIGEPGARMSSPEARPTGPGTVRAAYAKVLELAIPFDALHCRDDERLEFFVTIQIAESFGERYPIYGTFSAELPGKDFSERMWQV